MLGDRTVGMLWTGIKAGFDKLRAASDGVSAVEFAMILPIMVWLYIGAYEFGQAITIDRRVTAISSAAADLVAQAENTSNSDLRDIFEAAKSIMAPYDTSSIIITVTSVVADEDNKTTVDWSSKNGKSSGGETTVETGHAKGAPFTLPTGLTEPFTSVIVAEVEYEYVPVIGKYLSNGITLRETFYLRPRRSNTVVKTDT